MSVFIYLFQRLSTNEQNSPEISFVCPLIVYFCNCRRRSLVQRTASVSAARTLTPSSSEVLVLDVMTTSTLIEILSQMELFYNGPPLTHTLFLLTGMSGNKYYFLIIWIFLILGERRNVPQPVFRHQFLLTDKVIKHLPVPFPPVSIDSILLVTFSIFLSM